MLLGINPPSVGAYQVMHGFGHFQLALISSRDNMSALKFLVQEKMLLMI